jgi:hypothetical protein
LGRRRTDHDRTDADGPTREVVESAACPQTGTAAKQSAVTPVRRSATDIFICFDVALQGHELL